VEQGNLQNLIDWNSSYEEQGFVAKTRIPVYLCPSEVNDKRRPDPQPGDPDFAHYPLNYAGNMGQWFIFAPTTQQGGNGIFSPNSANTFASVVDGTSHTICFSEVKAYTPYLRDGKSPAGLNVQTPISPSQIAAWGGNFKSNSGHTEWSDARIHQTGFTTTFSPNTTVIFQSGGRNYDIDFNSSREGKSTSDVTYAAVTARSYHTGGVLTCYVDGSVHFVSENIDLAIWRALGSRDGGEVTDAFDHL
jgi:hypothetical protein